MLVKILENTITQINPNPPNNKKEILQLNTEIKNTATGAVITEPKGVPINVIDDVNVRSVGATQFASERTIVTKEGPSENPNKARITKKPAIADPPKTAIPISPAYAVSATAMDQNVVLFYRPILHQINHQKYIHNQRIPGYCPIELDLSQILQ